MTERGPRLPGHAEDALPPARIEPTPARATPTEQPVFDVANERQRRAMELLAAGTEKILTYGGFAAYLRMQAKFHHYSPNNVLLIMAQDSEATLVNSYKRWKELGRQVQKGEKGIQVFFPMFRMVEKIDAKTLQPVEDRELTGFGIGSVFDIRQTAGKPLATRPEIPFAERWEETPESIDLNKRAAAWGISQGLRMEKKRVEGFALGYYSPRNKQIVIADRSTDEPEENPLSIQKTKTLVHELAHYVADHRGQIDRQDAETVAESAAFVVMHLFGMDTGEYSFPYVATWAKDKGVLKRNLTEIQKVGQKLIVAVEGERPEEVPEWL
jgi:antirestriction protein ArdC